MEILALMLLAAVALVAAFRNPRSRKRWSRSYDKKRPFGRREASASIGASTSIGDSADQLRIVMRASFQKTRLLSRPEYDVFRVIETHLPQCGPGYRLMAQTSMGEILSSPDAEAFRCINSKRLDMLIIDTFGFPILAIEHQGNGHYQGDAPARDAVKREALRRAGVEYLEIFGHHQPAEIRQLVTAAIQRGTPPRADRNRPLKRRALGRGA